MSGLERYKENISRGSFSSDRKAQVINRPKMKRSWISRKPDELEMTIVPQIAAGDRELGIDCNSG